MENSEISHTVGANSSSTVNDGSNFTTGSLLEDKAGLRWVLKVSQSSNLCSPQSGGVVNRRKGLASEHLEYDLSMSGLKMEYFDILYIFN